MSTTALATKSPGVVEFTIRQFAESQIQQSIDKALAGLSPDKNGAVVLYADKEAVRGAVVARLGTHWSVVGVLGREWATGEIGGEAAVRFSW